MRKCILGLLAVLLAFDSSLKAQQMEVLSFVDNDNRALDVQRVMECGVSEQTGIEIIGEGLGEDRIGSTSQRYHFRAKNHSDYPISSPQWLYTLPLKDGKRDTVATSSDMTLSIPAIGDVDMYDMNTDGDLDGEIAFKCKMNGSEVTTLYHITLELKPKILSYSEIVKTLNETNTAYNVDFTVHYRGMDYLWAGVIEEYSSALEMQTVEEPYVAHVHISNINSDNDAWLVLRVENRYGKDEVVITLEKLTDGSGTGIPSTEGEQTPDISFIKVYTMDGRYIMQVSGMDDLNRLGKDVYILQLYGSDGTCFKTTKYMKM